MDIKLRDYQVDCIEKVFDRLSEGARHLSVVMTTGLGKNITSLLLAKQVISTKNAKIAMVFGTKTLLLQAQTTSEKLEITNIVFFSVSEFLINTTEYKYVFLYDLSAFDRRQIKECIKDKDIITISFSAPFLGIRDSGKKEIYVSKPGLEPVVEEMVIMPKTHYLKKSKDYGTDYYKLPSPLVCVYVTKEVIDIRDAKYAGKSENLYVKRENEKIFNWLHQQNVQVNIEIHEVKKHNKHLMAYMEALNQAKLQPKSKELVEKSERLKALLPEDERDKTIEELKARLEEREKQLREKDAIIAQQDQMIAFQQDILSGFGIDSSIIHDSFEQIQLVRASLKNDLENSNDTVKEIALKQLQDKVADIVSRLTQSALSTNDQEYFEEYLVGQLSEEVWNRLDDKSKSFLITAKSNYESMIKLT